MKTRALLSTTFFFFCFLSLGISQNNPLSITKTLSSPTGNPVQSGVPFDYQLTFSLNSPNLTNIVITDVVPSELQVLSVVHSASWTRTPGLGNTVELTFNQNNFQAGISGTITIKVRFKIGETCDGQLACNTATIDALDNGFEVSDQTEEVCINAEAFDRWVFNKYWDSPLNALDNPVAFNLLIRNPSGDHIGGMNMYNAMLTDVFPAGATFIDILGPGGVSIPTSFYTVSNNTLNLNINNYLGTLPVSSSNSGRLFQILLNFPSSVFNVGDTETNCATIDYEDACGQARMLSDCADVTLAGETIGGQIQKSVAENSTYFDDFVPGCRGIYFVNYTNTGNTPQSNVMLMDDLPANMPILLQEMYVSKPAGTSSATVTYQSSGGSQSLSPTQTASNQDTYGSLDNTIPLVSGTSSQDISQIKITYDNIAPGATVFVTVYFEILPDDATGTVVDINYPTISNCATVMVPGGSTVTDCDNFNIEDYSPDLTLSKMFSSGSFYTPSGLPGNKYRYRLRVQNDGTQPGNGLTLTDVLDSRLQYCGNETYFFGTGSNPSTNSFSASVPPDVGTFSTNHSGQNLEWNLQSMPGDCNQPRYFFIEFDVLVLPTAFTTNSNHIKNNFSATAGNAPTVSSNNLYISITPAVEVYPNKKVRKAGTLGFATNMIAQSGTTIEYGLCITNTGTIPLHDLVLVDMLPFNNDTKILDNAVARNSQYSIWLTAPITPPASFTGTIYYSNVADPDFTDPLMVQTPGTNNPTWTSSPAYNWTDVKNVKIEFPAGFILQPGATETFIFSAVVPVGVTANFEACNSFAYKATNPTNNLVIGPGESNTSCITVDETSSCCVGDFVWCDLDKNGLQDGGEPGKNGVTVNLIDATSGGILQTTVTASNFLGQPGYYQFCSLEGTNYRIEVVLGSGQFFTAKDIGGDDDIDSDIDPNTGQSPSFTIDPNDPNCGFDNLDIGLTDMEIISTNPCVEEGCVSACFLSGANLVKNPDFEQGNVDFTSELALYNSTPVVCDDESYLIGHESEDMCLNFPSNQYDHTYGTISGNFMIIDGHNSLARNVWNQTVNILPSTKYYFSFWALDMQAGDNPAFEMIVDGNVIGTVAPGDLVAGSWIRFCATYTSGPSTSGPVTLTIRQTNWGGAGLDYGLDDICFAELNPKMTVQMPQNITVCSGTALAVNPVISGANGTPNCSWTSSPNVWTANTCNPSFTSFSPGVYTLTLNVVDNAECPAGGSFVVTVVDCNFSCSCNEECSMPGPNLLVNGHFEMAGNPGFGSDLSPGALNVCAHNTYRVVHEPSELCGAFPSMVWDHTLGTSSGHFMAIDGNRYVPRDVWYNTNTINVNANTIYNFSFHTMNFSAGNPVNLEVQMNGVSIDNFSLINDPSEIWVEHCVVWDSDTYSGPVTITIRQTNFDFIQYDYGLDDICFSEQTGAVQVQTDPDATICDLSSLTLGTSINNGGASPTCLWAPAPFLDDPASCNPVFTAPAGAGVYTYTVTVTGDNGCTDTDVITITVQDCSLSCTCDDECTIAGQSLVTNGNFEQGPVGFTSGLPPYAGTPVTCDVQSFLVGHEARDMCNNFIDDAFDNTLGTAFGHYLIIDGHTTQPTNVYNTTVTVNPNTRYNFSFWTMRVTGSTAPTFDAIVNGQVVGNVAGNLTVLGQWTQHCFTWDAEGIAPGTPITITIRQTNAGSNGRDYGIDDVCFSVATPTVSTALPDDFTICTYDSPVLAPFVPAGASCSWFPTTDLTGANTCAPTFNPPGPGVYTIAVTVTLNGCTATDEVTITVVDCEPTCTCGVEGCTGAGPNLVLNGAFEQPGATVNSDLNTQTLPNCFCAGNSFCVDVNARNKCTVSSWQPILAPSGVGNYMVIDGSNSRIWYQDVNINNGQLYSFSFDFYPDISGDPSPTMALYAGNTLIQGGITGTTGMWNNICTSWVADASGTVEISIRQTADNGYSDYGIDNICFHELNTLSVTMAETEFCTGGNSYTLQPIITGGTPPYSCTWASGFFLSNPNICNPQFTPGLAGNYQYNLTITDANMCEITVPIVLTALPCQCECDREFFLGVGDGFNMQAITCRNRLFTPKNFDPACDQISWQIRQGGSVIHTSSGFSLNYTFPADGGYKVCMTVTRTIPGGEPCRAFFCQKIRVRCGPPYVDEVDNVLMNSGFSSGAEEGVLGQNGATSYWAATTGTPMVMLGNGCDDPVSLMLDGNAAGGDAVTQVVVLEQEEYYVPSFCYRYMSSMHGELPVGTEVVIRASKTPQFTPECEGECEVIGRYLLNPQSENWESVLQDPMYSKSLYGEIYVTLHVENDLFEPGLCSYINLDNVVLQPVSDVCGATEETLNSELGDYWVGMAKGKTKSELLEGIIIHETACITTEAELGILLNPGFEVMLGGEYTARIADCQLDELPPLLLNDGGGSMNQNDAPPSKEKKVEPSPTLRQIHTPENQSTILEIEIPEGDLLKQIDLFDPNGEKTSLLAPGANLPPGLHRFSIDHSTLENGVYFIQLNTDKKRVTERMTIIK